MTDGVIAPSLARDGSNKRQRSDQGPRLTERDIACLKWIAQQYAIRLDQLQRLLLRYTPEANRGWQRTCDGTFSAQASCASRVE